MASRVDLTEGTTFDLVVGTGGIGSGIVLELEGNQTLSREESRAATLLGAKDFCKLHIVFHYLQRLLGPEFPVLPIGSVGSDAAGTELLGLMAEVGLRLDDVVVMPDAPTLFAVSFGYPDGDGGNLTARHSASDAVSARAVRDAAAGWRRHGARGIAVALPEVPLDARRELLRLATDAAYLRVATFVPGEAAEVLATGMLDDVDLLALNLDEARAFVPGLVEQDGPREVAERAIQELLAVNDRLSLVITAGGSGSWSWDGVATRHAPALPATVVSTAGAGDAHLAGILTALVCGVELHEANAFGSLIGAMKVAHGDTINPNISARSVLMTAAALDANVPAPIRVRLVGVGGIP